MSKITLSSNLQIPYHPLEYVCLFTPIQVHRFVREKALHTNILGLEKPSCGSIYIFIISGLVSVIQQTPSPGKIILQIFRGG